MCVGGGGVCVGGGGGCGVVEVHGISESNMSSSSVHIISTRKFCIWCNII